MTHDDNILIFILVCIKNTPFFLVYIQFWILHIKCITVWHHYIYFPLIATNKESNHIDPYSP